MPPSSILPPLPHPITGVIFDFDGVIVDTEGAVYQAWQEVFQAHGGHLPLDLYVQCVGSDHDSWDPKSYFEEITGIRPHWPNLLDPKNQRTRDLLEGHGPMPGVVSCLEALRALGLPLAVASSSSRAWVGGWLERLGLSGYFHSWHCRDDVERVKPAPDLFLRAAAALNLPCQSLLVIEDSANGMKAALSAGMSVLAVPNTITASQDFTGAWHIADSLQTFPLATHLRDTMLR